MPAPPRSERYQATVQFRSARSDTRWVSEVEAPLLRLPSVELPPPPAEDPAPTGGSLAGRALLSIALLIGVVVVAVGVVVALVAVNFGIWRLGRVQLGLVVVTFAVVAALGRAVVAMVRRPTEPDDEVEVPAAAEPELHATVRELAGAAGTTPPDRVVVIAAVNAYVREVGPLLGLIRGRRTLAIGTPLLDVLTVSQLRAVLAHELGHFAGGDTRLGPLTYRTEISLHRMIESLRGHWIAGLFVAYWKFQHRITASVRRAQELVADRAAVRVAGRQAAADALQAVEVAGLAEQVLHEAYLLPLLQAGHRPADLASGLAALLAEDRSLQQLQAEHEDGQVDPWASHPPTPVRIARVAALPETEVNAPDERRARCLLRDPERWIRSSNERWLASVVKVEQMTPASWDQWGEVVVAPEQRARAASVDAALAGLGLPRGLDGLETALQNHRDREVAAALISAGWRGGGPDEREAVLRAAVTAVAARDAVDEGGFRWRVSWSGPVELVRPAGERLALGDLVERALQGQWAPLREAIGAGDGPAARVTAEPDVSPAPGALAAAADSTATELPPAPMPPFALGEGGGRWVELPARLGRKRRVAVTEAAISLNGAALRWAEITAVRFVDKSSDTTLAVRVVVATAAGEHKVTWTAWTGKKKEPILQAVGYLWDAVSAMVGPRLRRQAIEAVQAGRSVEVAELVLSPAGVAHRRHPDRVIAWSDLQDAQVADKEIVVTGAAGTKPLKTKLGARNAFLLDELLPALRALLG